MIKELKKEFEDKDIRFCIDDNEYDEDDFNDEEELNDNEFNENNPIGILKILYNYQEDKKLIPPLSEETINLLDFFKNDKRLKVKIRKTKKEKTNKKVGFGEQIIKNLGDLIFKIKESKINLDIIQNFNNNIINTIII